LSFANFDKKINALLKDGAHILSSPEIHLHLGQALKKYSKFRPLDGVADIAGDDGYTYALPSAFVDGFSKISSVEYPQGEQQPSMIALEEVTLYRSPTTLNLNFLTFSPATGKTVRLSFTALHTVTATASTVPASDEEAVSALAASIGCQALATHYAQTQDPSLAADTVNYQSKSSEYSALAKRLQAMFNEFLGLKEGDTLVAATGTGDWDTTYQWGGDRLLHPADKR